MTNRTAAAAALADQLQAAETHALDFAAICANHLDNPKTGMFLPHQAGPVRKIIDRFRTADESGGLTWCRHLKPGSPQPASWQAWRSTRLYCPRCVATLPKLSSKEDRRCDSCRHVGAKIWPHLVNIPGRQLGARPGKPEEARPPVVVAFGLCGRCQAAAKAAEDQAVKSAPCTFRMPPAGRQVASSEADLYRTAVTVAQAIISKDLETLAAISDGPAGLLEPVISLVILVTRTFLRQLARLADAPGRKPTPAELWDSIPATLARWEGYGPDAGLSSPEWRDRCTRSVELIKRVHLDDPRAFEQIDTWMSAIESLAGVSYVLGVVAQWPVAAGMAATVEQVWAEILASIDRWEAA